MVTGTWIDVLISAELEDTAAVEDARLDSAIEVGASTPEDVTMED